MHTECLLFNSKKNSILGTARYIYIKKLNYSPGIFKLFENEEKIELKSLNISII